MAVWRLKLFRTLASKSGSLGSNLGIGHVLQYFDGPPRHSEDDWNPEKRFQTLAGGFGAMSAESPERILAFARMMGQGSQTCHCNLYFSCAGWLKTRVYGCCR
tara:strand:- start:629 stop:937 length:309 start_codon:yes stop_codon:yes gene_type:complete